MSRLLVVLDFDGTFTDVEKEGAPFLEKYVEVYRDLVGRDVSKEWAEESERLASPEAAWIVAGQAVAPATCDPYIRATCIAHEILGRLHRFPDLALRTDVLQVIYSYCYRFSAQVFRNDAQVALTRIKAAARDVYVVTNSETSAVRKKLSAIGFGELPVIGNARKYVVDASHASTLTLQDIRVPDLSRPLLVRRPNYAKVLNDLWMETGIAPENTIVCGDIFELDLALPLRLGARAHLVERANTLAFERAVMSQFGSRATLGQTLLEAAAVIERLAQ